jgi:adenylate kinase
MPLVIKLLEQGDFHSGCLFDGFPRTVAQAAFLQNYLGERGQRIDLVLKLRVPREDLIARLSARAKLEGRADDSVEGIQRRLEIYQTRTEPVLSFYHELKIVREIDGSKAAGEVFSEIMDFVNVA